MKYEGLHTNKIQIELKNYGGYSTDIKNIIKNNEIISRKVNLW